MRYPNVLSRLALFLVVIITRNSVAQIEADLSPFAAASVDAVVPGELITDHPTLLNLGFEWLVSGDENRNAQVNVQFRKAGTIEWLEALPMLRLGGERIFSLSRVDVITPNMFAGSVLNLEPDTRYEVKFTISDPDGVVGEPEQLAITSTRAEPEPYLGGREFHVYPHGYTGNKQEPAFEGLMCAYNYWCAGTDWATSGRPRVRAGDKIIVHGGTYKYNRYEYTNDASVNRTTPLDGTYYLTADGTADRPISIIAAGDGEVIFDGNGNYALFDVRAADYTYFEGITFKNSEIGILAGTQFIAGSKGLTVKRSRFEDLGAGIFTNYSGSQDFYIADNYFFGRNDSEHLIGWRGELWEQFEGVDEQIFPPPMRSYVAIKLYGPGHVVAYNYIANFHDGINIETYGNPDGSTASGPDIPDGPKYPTREFWDHRPVAIDFYRNYITNSHDNPIEADGGMHNIRIMENMLINHPSHAFCNQPALGGPVYWIKNIAYHIPGGSTRITAGSAGVIFYNNTILSETAVTGGSNMHWRNNLFLGEESEEMIFNVTSFTNYSTSNFNGFRPNPDALNAFAWRSPAAESIIDITNPDFETELKSITTNSLADYSLQTGQDTNSIIVDYDIFVNVPRLTAKDSSSVQNLYDASALDFGLREGVNAIDSGMFLPTVTNGFTGSSPDLGALEFGVDQPNYGPRF
jgi:hypothetical protein